MISKSIDRVFYYELGQQIRKKREHLDMTQRELAKLLGISRPQLVNYEYGYSRIKPCILKDIYYHLNITDGIEITVNVKV